ncbi:hypothetical protein AZA_40473 [Nitrospirillum viridazoti Y2]|nr:hypothetical protein AZA_40473 [Nitrospirillum amazonense Y2]
MSPSFQADGVTDGLPNPRRMIVHDLGEPPPGPVAVAAGGRRPVGAERARWPLADAGHDHPRGGAPTTRLTGAVYRNVTPLPVNGSVIALS